MEVIQQIIMDLIAKYPIVIGVLSAVGLLRVVIKPVMDVFRAYVLWSADPNDDKLPDEVEASKWFKAIMYVVDLFASVSAKK